MGYRLQLDEGVAEKIREYVLEHSPRSVQLGLADGIEGALQQLAENPRLGRTPPGAFGRPLHIFFVEVEGAKYYLRVAYRYDEDEETLWVTGFAPLDL